MFQSVMKKALKFQFTSNKKNFTTKKFILIFFMIKLANKMSTLVRSILASLFSTWAEFYKAFTLVNYNCGKINY